MSQVNLSFKFLDPVFQRIQKLTKIQRVLICCGAFVLLVGLFVWLSYLPRFSKIDELKDELQTTTTRLAKAQRNAMQLSSYRDKIKKAEADFNVAKQALPEKQEIPSLLTSISRSGQDSNLDFLLFQPRPESLREFYAEIPLSLRVAGDYHSVALFFDKVSKLSRIVNIKDIKMTAGKGSETLETVCTAVTYKFVETPAEEKK